MRTTGHAHHHVAGAPAFGREVVPQSGRRALIGLVAALLAATVLGLLLLWPHGPAPERSPLLAPGVQLVSVEVTDVPPYPSRTEQTTVTAEVLDGPDASSSVAVLAPPEIGVGLHPGDRLRAMAFDAGAGGAVRTLTYFDHDRTWPMGLLALAYIGVVALVARGRGLRAVLGLGGGVAVVIVFLLPAILHGHDPLACALVAAAAMILLAVYLAHGVSLRTTTAVLGTFAGVAITAVIALATAGPSGMTGSQGETSVMLFGAYPAVELPALFLAGVVISGLGALNDVTITQASASWELRAAMPHASRRAVFVVAMRIGRDHIASTVYTLAFAYIGSALPVLLLASTLDVHFTQALVSGEIAEEVFRTLVASIGLVLAIPLTTAIACAVAAPGRPAGGAAEATAVEASQG